MKHTVKNWFGTLTLYEYFNSQFKRNKIGQLVFPASMIKAFNGRNTTITQDTIDKMTDSLGQSVIDSIVKKYFILTSFNFEYLMEQHQEYLKEAVCNELQLIVTDNKQMERVGAGSISTPSFNIGTEASGWVMTYDELGSRTKSLVSLADLPNYKIVGDGFIGRVAHNTPKGEIIVHQWNNIELGKELIAKDHAGQSYLNFTRVVASLTALVAAGTLTVDKYDYVYIKKDDADALFRFEGGDWKLEENWDRKDVRQIEGDRYLVYKNYMLAGTRQDAKKGDTLDYTTAQNGEVLTYNSTTGKGEWVNPSFAGDFTKISFQSTYSKVDFTKFDKWTIVQDMEGQLGFGTGEPGLVYVLDGSNVWGFPTTSWEEKLKANDWSKIGAIDIIDFGGTATAGPAGVVHHYGDLDDDTQRQNFMDNALIGQWYTFNINGVPYMVNITSGDKTTKFTWGGWRIASDKVEVVNGDTSVTAHTENGKTIQQMIDDSIALLPKPLTANYTSQVESLKAIVDLSGLTPGLTQEFNLPSSLTTDTMGGCAITFQDATQGYDLRGWDKSKALYLSVVHHDSTADTYAWVEIKLEAVAGDNTKIKLTNFKSGAAGTEMNAFGIQAIQFKGGL